MPRILFDQWFRELQKLFFFRGPDKFRVLRFQSSGTAEPQI
jgi:hypothetical protein